MVDLDMPVLRHVPLGDVHVRHDLDARDQGGVELLGRRRLLLQQARQSGSATACVSSKGTRWISLARSRRAVGNDQVDQIDDGRLIGHHLDVVQVAALDRRRLLRVEILDHLLNRHLVALGDLSPTISAAGASNSCTSKPVSSRMSSITRASPGVAVATRMLPSWSVSGSTRTP